MVSAPVDRAGLVLDAVESHPIPSNSNRSAIEQGREWVRTEILRRLGGMRKKINLEFDRLEALALSTVP
ncbi:hypothetical protein BS47DRAFT_1346386 [Hydnum rufescens UP504]|uniref:Uncharacterized protein n=1 Tax=Hydnum rufescens UP504 TaxID=1448309 RepID=A0A9P6ATG7_9AGAM|nr:hypothetical protein BS47DRAFT_1346386 [Hydnum rufescens UP504]